MDTCNREDRFLVIERIKNAFADVPRPIPEDEDIDNYWIALEELYLPEKAANHNEYEAIVQMWPLEMEAHFAETVSWILPRLMCGVLRDGVLNAPELVEYLNLSDTPFISDEARWLAKREWRASIHETFSAAQMAVIVDWLVMVRDMIKEAAFLGPEIDEIVDLEIDDWGRRLHDLNTR